MGYCGLTGGFSSMETGVGHKLLKVARPVCHEMMSQGGKTVFSSSIFSQQNKMFSFHIQ